MKWMNWSWSDLLEAPADMIDEILLLIQDENRRIELM